VNIKYHCEANGETGYHAHSKAFWSRLEKFNDNQGLPLNIVLDCSNGPVFYKNYNGIKICYNVYESTIQPEPFFNHVLKNWDYFWCPSEWQRQCTINQGYPPERVHVVPEGVDCKEFFPVADEALADKFTFIIIGKYEYRKATEEMIVAWMDTFPIEKYPNIKLVLSVDNWFDKVNVDEILKQIEDLEDPRIEILHFPPRDEYIKRLQTSHAFLSCSRSEGWNLPLIEAIACGVPTISSNYSAQLEYAKNISHLVNIKEMRPIPNNNFPGEYAEPDFEHFKSLMVHIYENWNECRQKALVGANYIRQEFSWERAAEIANSYLKQIEEEQKSKKIETTSIKAKVGVNFIDGLRFEISGTDNVEYHVKFIDKDHNNVFFQTDLKPTLNSGVCWASPSAKYFVNWKIEVTSLDNTSDNFVDSDTMIIKDNNIKIETFTQELNLKDQRVYINLDSKALGDNLAWMPYVEAFRTKHNCIVIVSTFWNNLFRNQYPELEFVNPGSVAYNLYAQYKIGCYDNDSTRNKNNWREVPLQKVAADILGLNYTEIRTKVSVNEIPRSGRRYVCISDHSTMQSKYWNYPGGWQEIVNYLGDLAFDVVAVSKDATGLTKLVPINNKTIEESASIINNCEFFIGVGSGLSWLAWALNKKVIMISGFSDPFTEFISDNYRLSPPQNICHGCFNDASLKFDRSWDWCPRNKDYECTKTITPEMVKERIDYLIKYL